MPVIPFRSAHASHLSNRWAFASQKVIERRAAALQKLAVLETAPEQGFDALTRLAANFCQTPIALVSLIDGQRLWFKAALGLGLAAIDSRRSFCCEAANSASPLEVGSARLDPRFARNELVTGPLGIQFYAGAPILYEDFAIGTVCVLDYVPRRLAPKSLHALDDLASIASVLLLARAKT